jgi:protein-disulfide isomerase
MPRYWKTPGWTDLPRLAAGVDPGGHHWIGARDPALTIVEFSDYECPHCRAAHKEIRMLAGKHPGAIRLVHRHLPLDMACNPSVARPFHLHACRFAEAAECAGRLGRFWEMNDALFSVQETTKADAVDPVVLAVRLGLDRPAFERCLETHQTLDRVREDVREAILRSLQGTPSFFLQDRLFLGRIPEAEIDARLREAR